MAAIYLKHDTHGHKVATDEREAQRDEVNGWERYTLDETEAPRKKGGRPPKSELPDFLKPKE